MTAKAIKTFTVEADSTPDLRYRILVKDGSGKIVENIFTPDMRSAWDELARRGYQILRDRIAL